MTNESQDTRKIDWEPLIAEQEKSDLSQKDFCMERGIVLSRFVYHRCSIKNKGKEVVKRPSFKPVKIVKKDESVVAGDIRLSLPNGFQCSFSSILDPAQIKKLVETLLSC